MGTNLDDVLLSIYKDFTIFSAKKKVILPKSDTIIFSEKINSYIKQIHSRIELSGSDWNKHNNKY